MSSLKRFCTGLAGGALLASLTTACGPSPTSSDGQVVGLSTSLPLVWREDGDIRGELSGQGALHWAVSVLAQYGRVVPLDTLSGSDGRLGLPQKGLLVLAQPRPLTPDENVSLDNWIRSGGRLLLFADPMLTASSHLPLGDPRGPQWAVMLSPILSHWGIRFNFDPAQDDGEQVVEIVGASIPVNLAGRFALGDSSDCALLAEGIAVSCKIGDGRVLAIADAAVLDGEGRAREVGLKVLLNHLRP